MEAPRIIPIKANCTNCGRGAAWRSGVGRYVLSHDDGDDVCSRESFQLHASDTGVALDAFHEADRRFAELLAERAVTS